MTPEDRIQHVERMIAQLQEDAEWLRKSGFWSDIASNADLVADVERAIVVYVSVFKELTRPAG